LTWSSVVRSLEPHWVCTQYVARRAPLCCAHFLQDCFRDLSACRFLCGDCISFGCGNCIIRFFHSIFPGIPVCVCIYIIYFSHIIYSPSVLTDNTRHRAVNDSVPRVYAFFTSDHSHRDKERRKSHVKKWLERGKRTAAVRMRKHLKSWRQSCPGHLLHRT